MNRYSAPLAAYLHQQAELDAAVRRVLASGNYVLGSEVSAFEREFADWLGGDGEAIGVASGTDALNLALRAFQIGAGDQVLTVSHTAGATITAILQCGAEPLLVDVDPRTLTLDPEQVATTIRKHKQPTRLRAMVVVHLYGQAADMRALLRLAHDHGLVLIEDCAQAIGTRWQGHAVGTLGDAAAFSFYPTKNLGAFGDGGMVYLDRTRAARVRSLRQFGWVEPQLSLEPGINSRLDELQAALLRVRLRALDAALQGRLRVARRYQQGLADTPLQLPELEQGDNTHGLHLYVVRSKQRDRLQARLIAEGIPSQIHYPYPVHQQPGFAHAVQIAGGGLEHSEQAAREVLSLPMHPYLADQEVDAIVAVARAALRP